MEDVVSLTLVVDRFEEDKVVLVSESEEPVILPRRYLPTEAHEGSVVNATFTLAPGEEKARRRRVSDLISRLAEKNR